MQFFISPTKIHNRKAVLSEEEAHHVRDVFRMRKGDPVRLFDGRGAGWRGVIAALSPKAVEVRIKEEFREVPRAGFRSILVQSLIPNDAMDAVVQKAAELGVDAVAPVLARRSQVRPGRERGETKRLHWEKVALAACKQCERLTLPEVRPLALLEEWLAAAPPLLRACYADFAEGAAPFGAYLTRRAPREKEIAVVIGPEGGFEERERELFKQKNIDPVFFGDLVLRSETAALYAASLMQAARRGLA